MEPKPYGPWKIVRRIVRYQTPRITVNEDEVVQPDGNSGIYSTVTFSPGVSVLPLDGEGNTYLVREFRFAIGEVTIETPTGGIDAGEEALAAAKRELAEETGITASEWIDLGKVDPFTAIVNSPAYLFLARDLSFGAVEHGPTEVIEGMKVPFIEAVRMVLTSEITHAQSCVLILRAQEWLREHAS